MPLVLPGEDISELNVANAEIVNKAAYSLTTSEKTISFIAEAHPTPLVSNILCLFVCFYGRPPEGRKVGVPIRDSASSPGLALVTPPSRH